MNPFEHVFWCDVLAGMIEERLAGEPHGFRDRILGNAASPLLYNRLPICSGSDQFQNVRNQDACSSKRGLSVADRRIYDDESADHSPLLRSPLVHSGGPSLGLYPFPSGLTSGAYSHWIERVARIASSERSGAWKTLGK